MFGLMSPQRCCGQKKTKTYRHHRMHYCGTCKTLGKRYQQKTRLLLNFDTVFLAELLSALHQENLAEWAPSFQAINKCLTLPKRSDAIPFSLEYAAATNMVLSRLKIEDNIQDNGQFRWRLAKLYYHRSANKAFAKLAELGTPKQPLQAWMKEQQKRELQKTFSCETLDTYLHYFAEPTAQMTALIFKGAVSTRSIDLQEKMHQLGYQFGQLNYILDAFEDLEEDLFSQQFNPLANWFKAYKTIADYQLEQVRQLLLSSQDLITTQLNELPLAFATIYAERLQSSLALKLYRERVIPQTKKERLRNRWQEAKKQTIKIIPNTDVLSAAFQQFLITFSIFIVPSVLHKMPREQNNIQWQWKLFFTALFANNDNLLDEPLPEDEAKPKQQPNNGCAICCLDCGSCDCGCADCICSSGEAVSSSSADAACCADCGGADCCCADCGGCDCACGGC